MPTEVKSVPLFDLFQMDAVAWLRTLPTESVDLIVTDPPYESLEKHRKIGTTTRLKNSKASSNPWFQIFPNERFEELLAEIYRVLNKHTHFYLFCDSETMFVVKPIAESVGFRFWKPLIWDKVQMGMGYHYRARCERILFFEKGRRRLNDLSIPDILSVPRIHRGYPTEKPAALMEILVSQSSVRGELVVDPFVGAGSVGVASIRQRRMFLGNDLSAEAVDISRTRLLAAGGREGAAPLFLNIAIPPKRFHGESARLEKVDRARTPPATNGVVSSELPQADNLERVLQLAEYLVSGRKISPGLLGVGSQRQVSYYRHAGRGSWTP